MLGVSSKNHEGEGGRKRGKERGGERETETDSEGFYHIS